MEGRGGRFMPSRLRYWIRTRFAPPLIRLGDVEARAVQYASAVGEKRNLFLGGQTGDDVARAGFKIERGVAEGQQ